MLEVALKTYPLGRAPWFLTFTKVPTHLKLWFHSWGHSSYLQIRFQNNRSTSRIGWSLLLGGHDVLGVVEGDADVVVAAVGQVAAERWCHVGKKKVTWVWRELRQRKITVFDWVHFTKLLFFFESLFPCSSFFSIRKGPPNRNNVSFWLSFWIIFSSTREQREQK